MIKLVPLAVLKAYEHLGSIDSLDAIELGLINRTYVVKAQAQKYVLQEVSRIFDVSVHDDFHRISKHLKHKGVMAPSIITTVSGDLFYQHEDRIFRAITYIQGQSFNTVQSLIMAEEAGSMLGRFHHSLMDLDYEYHSKRRHGGDYGFHQQNLSEALKKHYGSHDYFDEVASLAIIMSQRMSELRHGLITTPRNSHGDPKISNLIFNQDHKALCLIDFDTLGKNGWSLEVADALRSWCNPHKEDSLLAEADLNIATRALQGYGRIMRGIFSPQEIAELLIHVQAITLCLAMRYLTDVLNENYFSYEKNRFKRAAPHNLLRAQAMYKLYEDFCLKKPIIKELAESFLL